MISAILILIAILIFNVLPNALNVLVISMIVTILSTRFSVIFKKPIILYVVALLITIASVVYYQLPYFRIVTGGLIGYGIFAVVMFVGILPNKWTVSRMIKKVRGELSILGFIFISSHAFLHIFGMFGTIDLFGIAAYVIMVPLTFVSFKIIKKNVSVKEWLTIQKGAYGIYVLLFVHLLVVSSWENKLVYAVLGTLYINNRILKEILKK